MLRAPAARLAVAACVAVAATASGCGGGGGGTPVVVKPAKPDASARADAKRPRSASAALQRFWAYLQAGALPGAMALYTPAVVQAVGVTDLGGAYASRRDTVARTRLNIVKIEPVSRGALITAEELPPVGAPTVDTFFLRKDQRRRWRLAYDSFTAKALEGFVQQKTQRRVDPENPSSPAALKAADDASAKLRAAGLP